MSFLILMENRGPAEGLGPILITASTNHSVFSAMTASSGDKNARAKLFGSIAYVRGTDRFAAAQAIFITKLDSIEVANTVAFIEPGTNMSKKPFSLANLQDEVSYQTDC